MFHRFFQNGECLWTRKLIARRRFIASRARSEPRTACVATCSAVVSAKLTPTSMCHPRLVLRKLDHFARNPKTRSRASIGVIRGVGRARSKSSNSIFESLYASRVATTPHVQLIFSFSNPRIDFREWHNSFDRIPRKLCVVSCELAFRPRPFNDMKRPSFRRLARFPVFFNRICDLF